MKQENTNTILGNTSFQNRLAAYSTLAVAGACAVAAAPNSANADVVYSGPLNLSVAASSSGIYFNLATFVGYTSLTAAQTAGGATAPLLNLWGSSATQDWLYPSTSTVNRFESTAAGLTLNVIPGGDISASSTYGTSRTPAALATAGGWTAGTTGYLGIRFLNGATTDYGWVQIYYPGVPTAANPTRILGAAYENTGAGIAAGAGAVPEPGTVGCLAAGAIGAASLAWRRRKTA